MSDMRYLEPGESVADWTGGTSVLCKARGEDTGGAYALFELVSPAGTGSPPHAHHREDEALFVLQGEYEVVDLDAERTITATAGTYVSLPRGSRHSFRNPGPNVARMLILATPAGLEGFFEEVANAPTDALGVAEKYGLEFFIPTD